VGESCLGGIKPNGVRVSLKRDGAASSGHLEALGSHKSTSCAFLTSLRMRGSFPVATAKMARVTAICMSDLIPMIIPPRDLTVYLCGVPLWSALANGPKA